MDSKPISIGEVRSLLAALEHEAVPVMLIHGVSNALTTYPEFAARPLHALDLLVRAEHVGEVLLAAEAADWSAPPGTFAPRLAAGHPVVLSKAGGIAISVRTAVPWEGPLALWMNALSLEWDGPSVSLPDATSRLLLAITSGLTSVYHPPVHWVCDAALLLRQHGEEMDWSRLCRDAQSLHAACKSYRALRYLEHKGFASLPVNARERLERLAWSEAEEAAFDREARWQPRFGTFASTWNAAQRHPQGVLNYLAAVYGDGSLASLPFRLFRAALVRLRNPLRRYRP